MFFGGDILNFLLSTPATLRLRPKWRIFFDSAKSQRTHGSQPYNRHWTRASEVSIRLDRDDSTAFIHSIIHPSIHPFIYSFIHLFIYSSTHPPTHPPTHPSTHPPIHQSILTFIHSFIYINGRSDPESGTNCSLSITPIMSSSRRSLTSSVLAKAGCVRGGCS